MAKQQLRERSPILELQNHYQELEERRSSIGYRESEILGLKLHIAEHDSDPHAFSALHYPTCGGPESYAVTTNISRSRERLTTCSERMPTALGALADLEATTVRFLKAASLFAKEMSIDLDQPIEIPKEPRSLAYYRQSNTKRVLRENERFLKFRERNKIQHERRLAEDIAENEAKLKEADEAMASALSRMNPTEAAVVGTFYKSLRTAIDSGQFGSEQILRLASGDETVLDEHLGAVTEKSKQHGGDA